MSPYNLIDHASDVGIHIKANSLEMLFFNSINGLFYLITGKKPESIKEDEELKSKKIGRKRFVIRYDLIDDALIEILNKIILITYSKGILFFNPAIKIKKKKIKISVRVIKNSFLLMEREIKAATYHNFLIEFKNGAYNTTIIFDI